tara:strand:- start:235 stop:429 length:195 start_codon:yes stop_codon:yes gene_type:complete
MEEYDITDIIYSGETSVYTDEIVLKMAAQGYADIIQDDDETRLIATQMQLDQFMNVDLDKFLEE